MAILEVKAAQRIMSKNNGNHTLAAGLYIASELSQDTCPATAEGTKVVGDDLQRCSYQQAKYSDSIRGDHFDRIQVITPFLTAKFPGWATFQNFKT